jgi:hypothetical protein
LLPYLHFPLSRDENPPQLLYILPLPNLLPIALSPLAATLMDLLASVANKRLTVWLSPLDATLTKNRGECPGYGQPGIQ